MMVYALANCAGGGPHRVDAPPGSCARGVVVGAGCYVGAFASPRGDLGSVVLEAGSKCKPVACCIAFR